MALLVGDGPNRGKSAPSPRKLPKQAPREEAAPKSNPRNWRSKFTDSPLSKRESWGPVFEKRENQPLPPALAPRGKEAVQARNKMLVADEQNKAQADRVANMYQSMAEQQQRSEKRAAREKADRTEKATPFTKAEWAKLTPLQQAAAQANFDLMQAVKRDFDTQYKHDSNKDGDDSQYKRHEARVAELFGEGGRLGFKDLEYAPNTLAFLESRGIDKADLAGRTLDDLVSGDSLIDDKTFAAIGDPKALKGRDVVFAEQLASGQLEYQERLAAQLKRGTALLAGMTERDTNAQANRSFGALSMPSRTELTKVRPETAGQIDKYLQALARPDIGIEEALSTISIDLAEAGASPTEASQVWANLFDRTRQAATGEGKWFDGVDFDMRSPQEVAEALGATTLKRKGEK